MEDEVGYVAICVLTSDRRYLFMIVCAVHNNDFRRIVFLVNAFLAVLAAYLHFPKNGEG